MNLPWPDGGRGKIVCKPIGQCCSPSGCRALSIVCPLHHNYEKDFGGKYSGGSSQWYPLSHNAGLEFKGNYLRI